MRQVMIIADTLWLFNIAMGNGPFIDGLPIKKWWFSMAMFNNQMVAHNIMSNWILKEPGWLIGSLQPKQVPLSLGNLVRHALWTNWGLLIEQKGFSGSGDDVPS